MVDKIEHLTSGYVHFDDYEPGVLPGLKLISLCSLGFSIKVTIVH